MQNTTLANLRHTATHTEKGFSSTMVASSSSATTIILLTFPLMIPAELSLFPGPLCSTGRVFFSDDEGEKRKAKHIFPLYVRLKNFWCCHLLLPPTARHGMQWTMMEKGKNFSFALFKVLGNLRERRFFFENHLHFFIFVIINSNLVFLPNSAKFTR